MACCALAAFLMSQILVALQALRRLLGREGPCVAVSDVPWRLDMASVGAPAVSTNPVAIRNLRPRRPLTTPRWLLAAAALECVLLVGGVQWFALGQGRTHLAAEFESIARMRSVAELRELCGFERWNPGATD